MTCTSVPNSEIRNAPAKEIEPLTDDHPSGERRPIAKRLRYEVLRRDNHTCRYCGAKAPDATLTVDHVMPVALGGDNEPGNLVTACADCNAGKSSAAPDAPIVENVADDALRWAKAMEKAAEVQGAAQREFDQYETEIMSHWDTFKLNGDEVYPAPADWKNSLRNFQAAGLTVDDCRELIDVAMKSRVYPNKTWRYFCGCCWNRIRERQAIAHSLIEAEDGE